MKEESNLEAAPLRYAGVATLLRRPLVNDPSGVDIALIGVPYDGATENRPGPRHGTPRQENSNRQRYMRCAKWRPLQPLAQNPHWYVQTGNIRRIV